jgi:hypothetical protein
VVNAINVNTPETSPLEQARSLYFNNEQDPDECGWHIEAILLLELVFIRLRRLKSSMVLNLISYANSTSL